MTLDEEIDLSRIAVKAERELKAWQVNMLIEKLRGLSRNGWLHLTTVESATEMTFKDLRGNK